MRSVLNPVLFTLVLSLLLPLGAACEPIGHSHDDDDDSLRGPTTQPLVVTQSDALAMAKRTLSNEELPPAAVVQEGAELTQSSLQVRQGDRILELPLLHTDVDAEVSGFIADVSVHQLYANPFEEPIEATYLFPLPNTAAVNDMQMRIGDRVVVGEIKRREEAKQIYEAARDAGKTAALLDQERPNVFQQSVANILPGEAIEITIHFVQRLDYEDGGYEWAFPMVVGPRFIPAQGTGNSGGTTPTEDAERLSAPVSKDRTGNDISVSVTIDAGLPIQGLTSPSHDIDVERPGETTADIVLASGDSIPNKDFILRYEVAGDAPETAFMTHRDGDDGYFMLLLQPQAEDQLTDQAVTPKEMVFVIDTSCSQSGEPLARAKDAVELAINEMNPQDRFWILNFNSSVSTLSTTSLENNSSNRRRGIDYIRSFRGSGGTNMLEGIQAALDLPSDPELLRTVVFMTDGYIGNETEILGTIEERLGNSRIFSFGVGSSTNRYLLDRMAKVGRGHVQYIRQDEDPTEQVENFYDRIRNPVLTDIELEWEGVELLDVYPDPVPDLFSAQPLVLVGRYDTPGRGKLTVTGKVRGQEYSRTIPLKLPKSEKEHHSLSSLWARTVIEDLESRRYRSNDPDIGERIVELALEHRLMTKETSFVAVEERVVTDGNGAPKRVRVPLETPQGVSHSAIFGDDESDLAPAAPSMRSRTGSGLGVRGTGRGVGGYGRGSGFYGKRGGGSAYGGTGIGGGGAVTKRKESRQYYSPLLSEPSGTADAGEGAKAKSEEGKVGKKPESPTIRTEVLLVPGSSLDSRTQRVIERRLRGIEAAWKDWVQNHADSKDGTWSIRLSLDAEGKVIAARLLRDGLGVPSLATSFETQALNWTLPVSSGAGTTELEFKLRFSVTP